MKYVKFFDHIAIAFSAYGKKDIQSANAALTAALTSPDAKLAVIAMLDHNEAARRFRAASDIGVEVDSIGDELREETCQDIRSSDDDADDITLDEEDLDAPSDMQARRIRAAAQRITAFALKVFINKDGSRASSYNDADSFDSVSVQKILKKDILNAALPQPDGDFLVAVLPTQVQTRMHYLNESGNDTKGEPTVMPFKNAVRTAGAFSKAGHPVILSVDNGFAVGVFRGDLRASARSATASRASRDPKFAKRQYFASLRK
jgi:hypothetical protein